MTALVSYLKWATGPVVASLLLASQAAWSQPTARPGASGAGSSAAATKPPVADHPLLIAIIDIGAVLRDSNAALDLQRQMQEQQDIYQAAFDKEQRELRLAEDEIERERSSLSAEAYRDKRQAFQDRLSKATTDFRNRRRQLEEAFGAANAQINKALAAAIDDLATKNGINIVLRREAVLFQKDAIDMTQAAVGLLNERLPTVKIVLPPQP